MRAYLHTSGCIFVRVYIHPCVFIHWETVLLCSVQRLRQQKGEKEGGNWCRIALNLTAASEAYLSVIRCCDITLKHSTESIGFCPACDWFVVCLCVHICGLINSVLSGRLSTFSLSLFLASKRRRRDETKKKQTSSLTLPAESP